MELENFQEDLTEIKNNIRLLKNVLLFEGELTDWAKKELAKARGEEKEDFISLDEL